MATRWERLAGDTSLFALKLAFSRDPDDGAGIDPDVSHSWGGFQLWVKGRNLCAHREEGERGDHTHWYLLPLLEWLVHHWDPLLHEERLPARNAASTAWASLRETRFPPLAIELDEARASQWERAWQSWWQRHAIRAAGEGGLFPDVILRRSREEIEVSWGPTPLQGMPEHFTFDLQPGFASFPPRQVAEPLHEVLSAAGEYLVSLAPESHRIKALNRKIRSLDTPHKEARLAWLAGLGVDECAVRSGWKRVKRYLADTPEAVRNSMLATSGRSRLAIEGACQAALMFGTFAPAIRKEDVLSLADAMIGLHLPSSDQCGQPLIPPEAIALDDSGAPPWEQGHRLAEELHERLDNEFITDDCVDIERMLKKLGVRLMDIELTDEAIRAVAIAGPHYRPGIACNTNNRFNLHLYGRRFTLAHELCHLLFDRDAGQRLAIASGPWAPVAIERRANAFAAMLLMPTGLVHRAVSSLNIRLDSQDAVMTVVHRLQTGFDATLNHLENLGFIDDSGKHRIEADRQSHVH